MMEVADYSIIDESATSTCELVYRIYSGWGVEPTPDVARALLLGIAYDSRHFSIATPGTLNAASALLEIDGPIQEVLSMLRTERNRPEMIARIKAAQRTQLHDARGWVLATSRLGSFHASAARALIGLGADAAIVCGSDKGDIRASLRSTDRFYQGTRIHLGEVAQALGGEFGGAGSGHPTAAGVNGEGDAALFLERIVLLLFELLERAS
jgi:nanoRNase/pAp phosphatase (c-di-AMP/oligoRNAs hydrolase)